MNARMIYHEKPTSNALRLVVKMAPISSASARPNNTAAQCGERLHGDEDADSHNAMVLPARENDDCDAKCEDKYKIGESRCRSKCDRQSIGVPAQKAVGTRKHADAHADGGEEDLRRHGVLGEIEEVVLAGKSS